MRPPPRSPSPKATRSFRPPSRCKPRCRAPRSSISWADAGTDRGQTRGVPAAQRQGLWTLRSVPRLVEQMRHKQTGIGGDRRVRFAKAHPPRRVAFLMSDQPAPNQRIHPVEALERRHLLEDEPVFAIVSAGLDILPRLVEQNIRALAAQ